MPLVGKHLALALMALNGWMGASPSKLDEHEVSFFRGLINTCSLSILQSIPHKVIDGPDKMSVFPKTLPGSRSRSGLSVPPRLVFLGVRVGILRVVNPKAGAHG